MKFKVLHALRMPEKGALFEEWLVETLPKLRTTEIARAWRWGDTPREIKQRTFDQKIASSPDTGVDIMAECHDDDLIAIQAKHLHPDNKLVLGDLNKFWRLTHRRDTLRAHWAVATGGWGRNVASNAESGVIINAQTERGDIPTSNLTSVVPLELDEQQQVAHDDCVHQFQDHDRDHLAKDHCSHCA